MRIYIEINGKEKSGYYTVSSLNKFIQINNVVYYDIDTKQWRQNMNDERFLRQDVLKEYNYKSKIINVPKSLRYVETIEQKGLYVFSAILAIVVAIIFPPIIYGLLALSISFWIGFSAETKNRSGFLWGIFALLLPYICLFIFPFIKKINPILNKIIIDDRTKSERELADLRFNQQQYLLRVVSFIMIFGGFLSLLLIIFFW